MSGGAAVCIVGCLAASLVPNHQMPVASPPQFSQPNNVCTHCQVSPWGQKSPPPTHTSKNHYHRDFCLFLKILLVYSSPKVEIQARKQCSPPGGDEWPRTWEEIGGKTCYFYVLCSHVEIRWRDGVNATLQWFFLDSSGVECNSHLDLRSYWVTKVSSLLTKANCSQFRVAFICLESDHPHILWSYQVMAKIYRLRGQGLAVGVHWLFGQGHSFIPASAESLPVPGTFCIVPLSELLWALPSS